ncbi:MAG: hypothetical protein GY719_00390 [bacterium]|nr:hypothetical protein [bacterium]
MTVTSPQRGANATSPGRVAAPPASRSASNLRERAREALRGLPFRKRQVSFLLGTDEFIVQERRVAMTPRHVDLLRRDLRDLGLEPLVFVLRGAGEKATSEAGVAFPDEEYAAAGAELIDPGRAGALGPIDVVHALKEPTAYESELQGPLLRIGALHLASKPPGLCRMLARRNFAAILDGGTVGNCSYLQHGGDRTPIVASMSRFAGSVSGRKLVEGLEQGGIGQGTVIVVGAGIAGMSAIEKVRPKAARLIVIEPWQPARQRVARELENLGFESFEIAASLTDQAFDDAVGIVFAHRSGAKAAEKVCSYDQIRRMRPGAAIADIAIDQGGSILHDGYSEEDDATTSREKYKALLSSDYFYYAETNMPREEPHEASEVHGDCSLPYVTALLALTAHHGGPMAAARRILEKEPWIFRSSDDLSGHGFLDCIIQDLRNGVQLALADGGLRITDPDIERDESLAAWIRDCAC